MNHRPDGGNDLTWRAADVADVPAIGVIEHKVHTLGPERPEVLAEKIRLFGPGCRILEQDGIMLGYGLSHPWLLDDVPPLNAIMGTLPLAPDCLFLHDVAMLPEARGRGAGSQFVSHVTGLARHMGLTHLALVSVYGTYPVWEQCGFVVTPLRAAPDKLEPYGETARYMISTLV